MTQGEKINYHKRMEQAMGELPAGTPLALHSCCGPCSTHCLSVLAEHFAVTLYFYNPNIHPEEEYLHRLREQERLCEALRIPCVPCVYDPETYFAAVRGLEQEPEGGTRCTECFRLRLAHTAVLAKEAGIPLMTTTLSVSPHKNAVLLNELGEEIAAEQGIRWLPADFKKKEGYKHSIELSRQYGLYRQDYCGCVFSMRKDAPGTVF